MSLFVVLVGESPRNGWAKEFKTRDSLQLDPEAFALVKDHHLVCFHIEDYEEVFKDGPWFIASQLLVVESWVVDFIPDSKMVQRMVVWMWLPGLLWTFGS